MGGSRHHRGHGASSSSRKRRHDGDGSSEDDLEVRRERHRSRDDGAVEEVVLSDDDSSAKKKKHHKKSHHRRHKHKKRRSDEEDGEGEEDEEKVVGEDGSGKKKPKDKKKHKKSKRSKKKKRKLEDDYENISEESFSGKEGGDWDSSDGGEDVQLIKSPPSNVQDADLSPLSLSPRSHSPSQKKRDGRRGDAAESRSSRSRKRRRTLTPPLPPPPPSEIRTPSPPPPSSDRRRRDRDRSRRSADRDGGGGAGNKASLSLSIQETNKLRAKLGLKPLKVDNEPKQKPEKDASSLSIEETNRIRAKMGLKPLKVDSAPPASSSEAAAAGPGPEGGVQMEGFVHKPASNMAQAKKAEDVREKIRLRREKRELEAKLKAKAPMLAAKTADEDDADDSAAAWVRKIRDTEKEKREAEKRAKMLEELDNEFGLGDLVEDEFEREKQKVSRAKQYTAAHLKGVKVKHAVKDLDEGRDIVLTLEDKNVLDEEDDVLTNVNLKDLERARKNMKNRSKKLGYDAYDEDEEVEETAGRALLKQYDEVIDGEKADSFVLGGERTRVAGPTPEEKAAIKKRLKQVESLAYAPEVETLAREFYTKEEYDAKFRKKKKKVKDGALRGAGNDKKRREKKRRVLTADDLMDELAEPLPTDAVAMDVTSDRDDDSDAEFDAVRGLNDEDLSSIVVEPDEARLELEATLNRARKLRKAKLDAEGGKEETSVERLARDIRERRERDGFDDREEDAGGKAGLGDGVPAEEVLTFNETAEFARSLGDLPGGGDEGDMFALPAEAPPSPAPSSPAEPLDQEEVGEAMEISSEDDDVVELQQDGFGRWSKAPTSGGKDGAGSSKPSTSSAAPKADTVLEEEPDVSQSVVAALKLAAKKGYLDESKGKKHQAGVGLAALRAMNYTIEDKASMEDDFKATRRGRDTGGERYSGPLSDFKDKDNYKPEIKLDYIDDQGRILTPKEAFRYLSHKFHGKGSGKMKTEKRMKKLAEQSAVRQMSSTDTPLGTVGKMKEKQKESHTPFLLLSGNKVTSTGGVLNALGKQ